MNLKGVEAGKRRPRIPEGDYFVELYEAIVGKTKKEPIRTLVTWKFRVKEGKFEGTELWYRSVIQDGSQGEKSTLWDLRRTLEALKVKVPDDMTRIDFRKVAGRTCGVTVADGDPYQGRISSEIVDVFSEDLLTSDDDEDEYEEDEYEDEDEDTEDVDEDEDEEDEDEDEDEEEGYTLEELEAMDAKELRAVGRQLGVVKKGMVKADILEAIINKLGLEEDDEDGDEDEEDWEDEVDLDDEDL